MGGAGQSKIEKDHTMNSLTVMISCSLASLTSNNCNFNLAMDVHTICNLWQQLK